MKFGYDENNNPKKMGSAVQPNQQFFLLCITADCGHSFNASAIKKATEFNTKQTAHTCIRQCMNMDQNTEHIIIMKKQKLINHVSLIMWRFVLQYKIVI